MIIKHIDNKAFPCIVSYSKLVLWQARITEAIKELMDALFENSDELNVIDSTALNLLKFNRMGKVMNNDVNVGHKTITKWVYGLKAHVVINSKSEIVNLVITKGSEHDITPVKNNILKSCKGIVLADTGYVSNQVKKELAEKQCNFIAFPKKSMKERLSPAEVILYQNRTSIERVFSQLKLYYNLISFNPRSFNGFITNVYSAFVAYSINKKFTA